MSAISSFDVFDTALVRRVGNPTSLFLFVGRQLASIGVDISPAAFRASRIAAERRCHENLGVEQVTLDEIYRELKYILGWSTQTVETVKQLELQVETDTLCVNPRVCEFGQVCTGGGPTDPFRLRHVPAGRFYPHAIAATWLNARRRWTLR